MKADGAKSQSSIPQPSLGDYWPLSGSMWTDCQLANIIQDTGQSLASEARCVCDSCDECCDVNKAQSARVSRWTGGAVVRMVIMSVSHL